MFVRTAIGGVLFTGFVLLCWRLFIRKLWHRGYDPPIVTRGEGLHVVFH
jgi:xanthine/uracil permease